MSRFRSLMSGGARLSLSSEGYTTTAKAGSTNIIIYYGGLPLTENVTFSYSGDKKLTATKRGSTITISYPNTETLSECTSYVTINYQGDQITFTVIQTADTTYVGYITAMSRLDKIYVSGTYNVTSNYYNWRASNNSYAIGSFACYEADFYWSSSKYIRFGNLKDTYEGQINHTGTPAATGGSIPISSSGKMIALLHINSYDTDLGSKFSYTITEHRLEIQFLPNGYKGTELVGSEDTIGYYYKGPSKSTSAYKNIRIENNWNSGNFSQTVTVI